MARIRLEIVTAERLVFTGEVDRITAPGAEGELTILPRHAPLLTTLLPGDLRVVTDGQATDIAVSGGFLEVEPNHVRVLADTAERAEEIDVARAEEAFERARTAVASARSGQDVDMAAALAALMRSLVRLKVARRRRQHGEPLR
jgi:F-type H+-transporting ATPase subunit epsilon